MVNVYKTTIIICEGPSEENYIKELNKYFRESSIHIILTPKVVGTGEYKSVIKKYREVYQEYNGRNKKNKMPIEIWVDFDIYHRDNNNCMTNYKNKPKLIPDFLFSYENFEDFLVLHEDKVQLQKWEEICNKHNHFDIPLHENKYLPLLRDNIFPGYEKGSLPINIDKNSLNNLFEHNNNDENIKIKSDFASFLSSIDELVNSLKD